MMVRTFAAALLLASPAAAADFYQGKTLTIIVGFTAGGGYDLTARLYARHWGRHIAGNPSVVVSNMPGAGSAVAATSLYSATPQDGSRVGIIAGGAVIEPLLGQQAKYDARNPAALKQLVGTGTKLHAFPKDVLDLAFKESMGLYSDVSAKNPSWKKIYDDYAAFRKDQNLWFRFAEAGFDDFMQSQKGL